MLAVSNILQFGLREKALQMRAAIITLGAKLVCSLHFGTGLTSVQQ